MAGSASERRFGEIWRKSIERRCWVHKTANVQRFTGADVVVVPEEVCRKIGFPKSIRVDQGPEFISEDLDLWAYPRDVELDF